LLQAITRPPCRSHFTCTQFSPPFSKVAESVFSILVKFQNFTKHAFCQQTPHFCPENESYCCNATILGDRSSRDEDGWKLTRRPNLFSEFSVEPPK
jgi:hypothetical protein